MPAAVRTRPLPVAARLIVVALLVALASLPLGGARAVAQDDHAEVAGLVAALELLGLDGDQAARLAAGSHRDAVGDTFRFAVPGSVPATLDAAHADIRLHGSAPVSFAPDVVLGPFGAGAASFPCGDRISDTLFLCASAQGPSLEVPHALLWMTLAGPVPHAEPGHFLHYAFPVLTEDGSPWEPVGDFGWDTYSGTNRWHELVTSPGGQDWGLTVVEATGEGFPEARTSRAFGIIHRDAIVLAVPGSEFIPSDRSAASPQPAVVLAGGPDGAPQGSAREMADSSGDAAAVDHPDCGGDPFCGALSILYGVSTHVHDGTFGREPTDTSAVDSSPDTNVDPPRGPDDLAAPVSGELLTAGGSPSEPEEAEEPQEPATEPDAGEADEPEAEEAGDSVPEDVAQDAAGADTAASVWGIPILWWLVIAAGAVLAVIGWRLLASAAMTTGAGGDVEADPCAALARAAAQAAAECQRLRAEADAARQEADHQLRMYDRHWRHLSTAEQDRANVDEAIRAARDAQAAAEQACREAEEAQRRLAECRGEAAGGGGTATAGGEGTSTRTRPDPCEGVEVPEAEKAASLVREVMIDFGVEITPLDPRGEHLDADVLVEWLDIAEDVMGTLGTAIGAAGGIGTVRDKGIVPGVRKAAGVDNQGLATKGFEKGVEALTGEEFGLPPTNPLNIPPYVLQKLSGFLITVTNKFDGLMQQRDIYRIEATYYRVRVGVEVWRTYECVDGAVVCRREVREIEEFDHVRRVRAGAPRDVRHRDVKRVLTTYHTNAQREFDRTQAFLDELREFRERPEHQPGRC